MAKLGKGWRRLIAFFIIILPVILFINAENISYLFLPKYEYYLDEMTGSYVIDINGILYRHVSEKEYNNINDWLEKAGIYTNRVTPIGRINLYTTEKWKYRIYGNKDEENRILLRGEEAYLFNDANYPEVFFCREDVLKSYQAQLTEE